jgi:hypothetical protein
VRSSGILARVTDPPAIDPEATRWTAADFASLSFHDDSIYGVALRQGDPDAGDWTSDLVLDLDHLVAWVREADRIRFRVAPATLAFHDVTELRVAFDWRSDGHRVVPPPAAIDRVERAPAPDRDRYPDSGYWAWRIVCNAPPGGEIVFQASGFTLALRRAPVLLDVQQLPARLRGDPP